ncbi:hypothetical protein [Streptomyces sp. CBMA123]|uniref:hypothetical protein n=1 Tax=Streptomyces sp. CBMA123 TaxID=1896313 RepID=UPI001661AF19|nr:hypothetical protein [Streptomyces sp. CBMA123]MBD0694124.1 hypothetical protein [Streptomyces sp. CBMA123]
MYKDLIEARIRELDSTAGFALTRTEIRDPVPRGVLDTALRSAGGHLPAGAAEFYEELNGFTLQWTYTAPGACDATGDEGSIRLLPLDEVFSDWQGAIWFDDFEGGDRFRAVKPFDLYIPEACAAFLQEPGEPAQDTVHYHYIGESLSPLPLSFPEYLAQALNTAGYLGWQSALTPRQGAPIPVVDRMREIVPGFVDRLYTAQ